MSSVLFCLQLSPIDANDALDLASLIADIQRAFPAKCNPSWFISYRQDTPLSRVFGVEGALVSAFNRQVWVARAKRFATGWPAGPNALWRSAMEDIADLALDGKTGAQGVLTFEPDCIPLAHDWIDRLEAEYSNRVRDIVGNFHQLDTVDLHINGNSMWPVDLAKRWPQVLDVPTEWAWDYFNREFFLPYAQDTPLIAQIYRRKVFKVEEWNSIRKHDLRPVLLHGIKDHSGRRIAREQLLYGVPVRRPTMRHNTSRAIRLVG
jgi:hypothetical protein